MIRLSSNLIFIVIGYSSVVTTLVILVSKYDYLFRIVLYAICQPLILKVK